MQHNLIRLVGAGVVGAFIVAGYATWRIWEQGERDERRPADAIVVLGAAQYDGRPSPVFRARLEHAIALHQAGVAPWLVVTGGKAHGDRTTEAAAARTFAITRGVDPAAILVEDEGRTTMESLRNVSDLVRDHDLRRVVFVSDRTHMLRVLRIARNLGVDGWGSPTTSSPIDAAPDARLRATVHELAALGVLFVTGGQPPGKPGD